MDDVDIGRHEALMHAHENICREIEVAEREASDSAWGEGHINGLKEARNRVEEIIAEDMVD